MVYIVCRRHILLKRCTDLIYSISEDLQALEFHIHIQNSKPNINCKSKELSTYLKVLVEDLEGEKEYVEIYQNLRPRDKHFWDGCWGSD